MRTVIVSNRLPFTARFVDEKFDFESSSGGVATGLLSYLNNLPQTPAADGRYVWFGWPGTTVPPEQQPGVRERALSEFNCEPVFLGQESMENFYEGFCNKTVWPLFHYFPSLARYEESYWQEYKAVNEAFAQRLLEELRPDDVVWIHDYQLMLLPKLIRERFPTMAIGFFLHIPFPSWELFRLLPEPWRKEILEGILGAGLVGFHTHDYTRHFLSCVLRGLGHEHQLGCLTLPDRTVKVDTFPMGVDYERFHTAPVSAEAEAFASKLRTRCPGQKIIFSVDRLDYTKGLLNRLRGYELFLKNHPEWRGKVRLVLSVAPSRIGVETYAAMKQELERLVGQILGAHGNVDWAPLVYQYTNLGFQELLALYRLCDVAMITPLRDGMNLVAKEFVASRNDRQGVLVLSEMAGAAKELGEALLINPYHIEEFATAIERALTMPEDEQVRRLQLMQERLCRYSVHRWASDFTEALLSAQGSAEVQRARSLKGRAYSGLVGKFAESRNRALLLDYDGTLVPFAETPRLAVPDPELLQILSELTLDPRNKVAIVSGRPRAELEQWFGVLPLALIAEHGVWLRPPGGQWALQHQMNAEWKNGVRPLLQHHVDRLPGALLEEKEFSIAWHYRRADVGQAAMRAKELLDDLSDYTRNIDIQVLEGDKVLEVRRTSVTKGTAGQQWLQSFNADFVMAVGDDWTDEDLFLALPRTAWTIRVGLAATSARYFLPSHEAVRGLLRAFTTLYNLESSAVLTRFSLITALPAAMA